MSVGRSVEWRWCFRMAGQGGVSAEETPSQKVRYQKDTQTCPVSYPHRSLRPEFSMSQRLERLEQARFETIASRFWARAARWRQNSIPSTRGTELRPKFVTGRVASLPSPFRVLLPKGRRHVLAQLEKDGAEEDSHLASTRALVGSCQCCCGNELSS